MNFGIRLEIINSQNIFLSYNHSNKNIVYAIADKLKAIHIIWIDRDNLKAGVRINEEISKGIRNSSLFICFISEGYCKSIACKREIALADSLKKKILPVMLQREAKNGIELIIAELNTFYAFKTPDAVFDPWSEDLYQKLVQNISDLTKDVQILKTQP